MKIRGQDFWHEPDTGRLYCWWRVLAFLGVALLATYFCCTLLAFPFLPPAVNMKAMSPAVMLTVNRILTVALIVGFWVAAVWAVRRFEQLPPETLGLSPRGPWLSLLLGSLLVGLAIPGVLGAAFLLCGMASLHHHALGVNGWRQLGVGALFILLLTVKEEIILHGYLLQTMLRGIGLSAWLLISGCYVAYAYTQAPETPPIVLANLLVLVLLFGMVYLRTGTLWACIGLSTGWSLGLLLLHPTAVDEGQAGTVFPPIFLTLHGPSWLSGGAAGPEGSAALSLLLLLLLGWVTYSRKGLALDAHWWEWRNFQFPRVLPAIWDFAIGSRYYQWKLLLRDEPK